MSEKYIVKSIYEYDYGCEGLPENDELKVVVVLEKENGETVRTVKYDCDLIKEDINENDMVELIAGKLKKIQ